MRARGQTGGDATHLRNTSPEIPGAVIGWLAGDEHSAVALAGQVVKAHRTCREQSLLPGWPPAD